INVVDRSNGSVRQLRHDPKNPESLSDDRVMALLTDTSGRIWAGTMTGGLNRIDPENNSIRSYRHDSTDPTSLGADGIMSLLEDSRGNIWIGTFGGGVSRLNDAAGVFSNFRHDAADETTISSPRATSIVEDLSGVIWVGTDGGGLNRLDSASGTWLRLRHNPDDPASLSADTVYALHVDAAGTLWAGTRAGLDRLNVSPGSPEALSFQNISRRDGLTSNTVYGIRSDSQGNLWLSTNNGLNSYDPETGRIRNFHESQGLQGEEFNFGASYTSPNGELFFGGSNGFNAFIPENLEFNQGPPPVVLTSLSILNKPVTADQPHELTKGIDLDYSDDVVTFEISALDFAAPHQNLYAYKLEGFDTDWVEAGTQRRITYTNLDGGNYVLRVKAANSDGVWNEDGMSVTLSVAYPPWRTWWAYALYVLAAVLAAYGLVRRQQQKLKREAEYSRRLEKQVRDRTKELNDRNADLKEANAKLVQASTTDVLTGLKNRRYLFEQIDKDVELVLRHYRDGTETMKPGGNNDLLFVMVDLDHFKPVNDGFGHEAGDKMLLQVRDVLLESCRISDDIIRWGGDEFLIIARETNRKFAPTLVERIRSDLSGRVLSLGNGQVARTTASIGYASYPFFTDQPDLLTWEEVLGVADAAMYEAKQKRNAWLGIEGIEWSDSGTGLYRAIKTDPGQLAKDGVIQAIESVEEAAEKLG
ncbi:MAG: diguanylate cyclase, partial [Gammaproteobacteria bacterium]|nr:diguanylate cyclase [Gammaproteobacteria bacterium]